MLFNLVIVLMVVFSLVFGALSGNLTVLSAAAVSGAKDAVTLSLSLCGMICLWSGVMELMKRSGLSEKLSRLMRPVLSRLFPSAAKDADTMDALSSNVSANLLGLGNAATPAGIKAAVGLKRLSGLSSASDELCLLVVMNTASIQLLPTTVASLRASFGASSPFDILPAVWLSSLISVTAGILAAKLFQRFTHP
ncbi:MAG: spore maturation protein A [Firmicutes bacterium HGW-Firmicutes-16]|nr:MAG: spore maturation protein A [Firmicutes bacterium HGW-Firmicutes-16]